MIEVTTRTRLAAVETILVRVRQTVNTNAVVIDESDLDTALEQARKILDSLDLSRS